MRLIFDDDRSTEGNEGYSEDNGEDGVYNEVACVNGDVLGKDIGAPDPDVYADAYGLLFEP